MHSLVGISLGATLMLDASSSSLVVEPKPCGYILTPVPKFPRSLVLPLPNPQPGHSRRSVDSDLWTDCNPPKIMERVLLPTHLDGARVNSERTGLRLLEHAGDYTNT